MSDPTSRVAIVTGASRGIGRRVATRLARSGYAVAVGYGADAQLADAVVADITAQGGTALAALADVADEAAVGELFDLTQRHFGGIDVVVHAAGVMPLGPVADFDLATFDAVVRTNIRGTFVVSQHAARRLRPGGALINLSSTVTRLQRPGTAAYTMTKGAVENLTLTLARELDGRDITVNAVAPGPIRTEMLDRYLRDRDDERAGLAAQSPLQRLGTIDDVAEVIEFLAGPGRWINGQVLFVNGGVI